MLFQELRLFTELTAWENVQLKNSLTGFKSKKEIKAWFEQFGIADKWDTPVAKNVFRATAACGVGPRTLSTFRFYLSR